MSPDWTKRWSDSSCWDASLVLAVMYTLLYAAMVMTLAFVDVPTTNEKTVDMLIGIMSAIQMSIVGRYFGGSKSADDAQQQLAHNKEKNDTALREVVIKETKGASNGNN